MYLSMFNSLPLIQTITAKNCHFYVQQPTFLFPLEIRCDYHATCCIDGKTIQCLPKYSQHVHIYKCLTAKIAIFYTYLFFPENDPKAITLNVFYFKRQCDAYKMSRSSCSAKNKMIKLNCSYNQTNVDIVETGCATPLFRYERQCSRSAVLCFVQNVKFTCNNVICQRNIFVAAFAVNRCMEINIKAISYVCKYTYELTQYAVHS